MATKEADNKIYDIVKKCTVSANTVIDRKRIVIPVSPVLDDMLGGGFQSGSLIIINGKYKVGKTTTCLHFAKKAQKFGYKIYYLNVEARLTRRDLTEIPGLDLSPDKFEVIEYTEEYAMTGEDFIAVAELKLKTEKPVVVIIDSFSQLICEQDQKGDIRERTRDSMPLTLSKFCKRVSPILNLTNNICIGITHDIANQGYGYSPTVEASGRKIQYANNFKLAGKYAKPWIEEDPVSKKKVQIGQEIQWECVNSALGAPGKEGIGRLRYGHGIDEITEFLIIAEPIGIVKKSGSWYVIQDQKLQGQEKAYRYLLENPEIFNSLYEEVRSRLDS